MSPRNFQCANREGTMKASRNQMGLSRAKAKDRQWGAEIIVTPILHKGNRVDSLHVERPISRRRCRCRLRCLPRAWVLRWPRRRCGVNDCGHFRGAARPWRKLRSSLLCNVDWLCENWSHSSVFKSLPRVSTIKLSNFGGR